MCILWFVLTTACFRGGLGNKKGNCLTQNSGNVLLYQSSHKLLSFEIMLVIGNHSYGCWSIFRSRYTMESVYAADTHKHLQLIVPLMDVQSVFLPLLAKAVIWSDTSITPYRLKHCTEGIII